LPVVLVHRCTIAIHIDSMYLQIEAERGRLQVLEGGGSLDARVIQLSCSAISLAALLAGQEELVCSPNAAAPGCRA